MEVVMLLMTLCGDEFFFDSNILKTKDKAIGFRGLPPTVIEGKEIELVDSYKYLLIANYASRTIQEQSVPMLQQRSFFLQEMISFNVADKR